MSYCTAVSGEGQSLWEIWEKIECRMSEMILENEGQCAYCLGDIKMGKSVLFCRLKATKWNNLRLLKMTLTIV